MKTGIELIREERERQVSKEGWTADYDDTHANAEMAEAAACYIEAANMQTQVGMTLRTLRDTPQEWPWDYKWWKPDADPVRNLVKAGALIAAEIDRLQRAGELNNANEPTTGS
jgi:hypothetical protein